MKNSILSFGIFILMIGIILFSINTLEQSCFKLKDNTISLENYILKEDWEESDAAFVTFLKNWNEECEKISIFIHHQELDNIDLEIAKLTNEIKFENKEEALSSLSSIKFLLDHIVHLEKMNFRNIF